MIQSKSVKHEIYTPGNITRVSFDHISLVEYQAEIELDTGAHVFVILIPGDMLFVSNWSAEEMNSWEQEDFDEICEDQTYHDSFALDDGEAYWLHADNLFCQQTIAELFMFASKDLLSGHCITGTTTGFDNWTHSEPYRVIFYDKDGNREAVRHVATLEQVAMILSNHCNGVVSGSLPTVWYKQYRLTSANLRHIADAEAGRD